MLTPFNDWLLQHYQSIKADYALNRNRNIEFQKFLKLQDIRMTACLATCLPAYLATWLPAYLATCCKN